MSEPHAAQERPRRFTIGLLPRIGIAILLGVGCGLIAPEWFIRVFVTLNMVFGGFLNFMIPLIILGLIAPAIGSLGRGAGMWLAITAGIAYLSTLIAGGIALATGMLVFPHVLSAQDVAAQANPEDALLAPYFEIEMAPMFPVMTALILAFVVGIGLTLVRGNVLMSGFEEFREIVNRVIAGVLIPLLPVYIFGIILNMTAAGEAFRIVTVFLVVVVIVFALTVLILLLQYGVAGAMTGRNPLRMLATMMPAYATALGTSSSAATIPVTLRQSVRAGVSEPVASFVVPLCATVHLAGSTLKITSFALAIMYVTGTEVDLGLMIGFLFMLGVTMIAAPGVPGGAIMAASGLLTTMLGFDAEQVGLMVAAYIALDSFGTATNVTGDGAIAAIVDRLSRGRIGSPQGPDAATA